MNASDTSHHRWLWTGIILTGLFVLVPLLLSLAGRSYFYQIANTIMIFALLAASMHLVTGVAGLLQLGHAAFYGIGGYCAALLATHFKLSFVVTIPLAGMMAGLIAFLVAVPTMRLVSIYFAVATLGIGQMLHVITLNWVPITKGPNGILLIILWPSSWRLVFMSFTACPIPITAMPCVPFAKTTNVPMQWASIRRV